MDGVSVGRIVHYVMPDGQHRPAIVVRTQEPSPDDQARANLTVFFDGDNDAPLATEAPLMALMGWRPSVPHSDGKEPGTWHWPERA